MWCRIAQKYIGKNSIACEEHLISWAGLAEQKEKERKNKEMENQPVKP